MQNQIHKPEVASIRQRLGSARWLLTLALLIQMQGRVPLLAQETETQSPSFLEAVDVRVINVDVSVTDKSGVPVAGLSAEDFELKVDGEVIPITNFYAESGGRAREVTSTVRKSDSEFRTVEEVAADPRRSHVVVLVDHSRLRPNNRKRAFTALRVAVDRLAPQDLVAIVGIEKESVVFYSDFLYDRQAIHRVLDRLLKVSTPSNIAEIERRQIVNELTRGQSGGIQARASLAQDGALMSRVRAYAAQEYQRGIQSLQQIEQIVATMAGIRGRKALFYLGEGVPTRPGEGLYVEWRNRFGGSESNSIIGMRRTDFNTDYTRAVGRYDLTAPMRSLASSANRSGVTMYAIDAEGSHGALMRSALSEQGASSETLSVIDENYRTPLEYASKATGGRLLQSSGLLSEQLTSVVQNLGVFYSLGFSPPESWEPGSDHRIKIKVVGKGLDAWHRETVGLPQKDEREASATVAALMYQSTYNPLSVIATPEAGTARDDGSIALPILLELPVALMGLLPMEGMHQSSLTIYVTTKSKDGRASQVQKIPFNLSIPDDKLAAAQEDSAYYTLPVVLRPGDQQVAIGIRDNIKGLFSAIRVEVTELSSTE